jgi:hypothetical protein
MRSIRWRDLSGLLLVLQAALCDCLLFDPFSFRQDGSAAPEVDVGGCEIAEAS